jgi:hypothetical protein
MATRKQKEELMQVLKFTPITYRVTVSGYGGEIAMGRVDLKTVNYFKKNKIDLNDYACSWGEPGDDDYIDVPEELQPFTQSNWYECDNIEHNSGAEFGGSWLTITDENDNEIFQQELGHNLEDLGCDIECFCSEDVEDYVDEETAVFVGQSFEKGCFFDGELHLKQPFDVAKFKFTYSEVAGWPILNVVEYDGEELEGSDGYSTTGKSSDYKFYYRDAEGEVQEYSEPEDTDDEETSNEGVSAFSSLVQALVDAREENWNSTDIKPAAKGVYECKFVNSVWPLGDVRNAEWTGRSWKENGKKAPDMISWREVEEE